MCVSLLSLAMWPVVCQAIPITVPPILPPPIALLFILLYIPVILLSMLFNKPGENVMKNSPRKNILTRRARDETRFIKLLMIKSLFITISVCCVGWLAATSAAQGVSNRNNNSSRNINTRNWANRMGSFQDLFDNQSMSYKNLAPYYHVQVGHL